MTFAVAKEDTNISVKSNFSDSGTSTSDTSLDNLYAAILQCFVIILAGYVAGRANILTSTHGKGLGSFVSYFCLPALLFQNMCILDFSVVDWYFLAAVLISKTLVFVFVVIVTLLVAKRPMSYGYAGLFAIFCTQSNDFALGFPIIQALWGKSHPEYLKYIYLIAPISVVFLNPIGFAMLEAQKRKTSSEKKADDSGTSGVLGNLLLFLHILKGVVKNPIVFMTMIGLAGNFIFSQKVPYILADILQCFGNAFSAVALFYLGLSMVGKFKGQMGKMMIVPLLLIGVKAIVLPLVTWHAVGALERITETNNTSSMSMFGFMYGTFPTAPSVFLYASQYSTATNLIATGMVSGTFLSALLMFISARMMAMAVDREVFYKTVLLQTASDISIVSIVCCVWVIVLLIFSQRIKKILHQFLLCMILSHLLSCTGMIMYNKEGAGNTWRHYVQFSLILTGVFGSRCWTAVIALTFYFLHSRSLHFVMKIRWVLYFLGFGVTLMSVGILFSMGKYDIDDDIDPVFHYGVEQSILSVVILILCSSTTIVSLVLRNRKTRQNSSLNNTDHEGRDETGHQPEHDTHPLKAEAESKQDGCCYFQRIQTSKVGIQNGHVYTICISCGQKRDGEIPDDVKDKNSKRASHESNELSCRSSRSTSSTSSSSSSSSSSTNEDNVSCPEDLYHHMKLGRDEFQTNRFTLLLIIMQLSMLIGLFLCTWRLFNHSFSGIYVEIEFIDGVFNYGQGFIILAIFGFDTRIMIMPLVKRWRRLMYGAELVRLPRKEDLKEETTRLCEQFVKYHKETCCKEIVKNLKYHFRDYKRVFTGATMCNWLMEVGLAKDRGEAVAYGRNLLIGRIISHVTQEHYFYDTTYFYRFNENLNV